MRRVGVGRAGGVVQEGGSCPAGAEPLVASSAVPPGCHTPGEVLRFISSCWC